MNEQSTPGDGRALEPTLTASRALLGVVARSLAGTLDSVSLPQFRALVILSARGPVRMGDLAHLLGVHQSSFSRTADRMEAAGLIVRGQSPESRREVLVTPTEKGLRIVDEVTEARRQEIAAILGRVSPGDQEKIALGFALFAQAAGEASPAENLLLGI
ncbi:MarR family winged helix-turn-helix transcriptional regulator [Pseudarthrobacter sp. C4D7]|uniref:MarR family winged helix-turn-helix transcriptional regulator n=1 Tax=Pseudarthrobacter sp. C4D7 TaxID=2735268 RepID=UPI001584C407|nr:MarR family transcriptional regulator [Pseudarthrobacter sp. C4D7]NUT71296.1 MarR family transcriptional regulator [Pseudarthrobacter sp. C4D7]